MKRTLAIILALVMALTMTFTGTAFGAESDTYLALGAASARRSSLPEGRLLV